MKHLWSLWAGAGLACSVASGCRSTDDVYVTPESVGIGGLEPAAPALDLLSFECREDAAKSSSVPSAQAGQALTLRDTGHTVGVAISAARLDDPVYAATAGAQFNQLTPENEMKWEAIEPEPGVFDFGPADKIVEFARQHGMKVRGHTLVWHSQLAPWVNELSGPDAVREAMTRHIEGVVGHFRDAYPGMVVAWDVVNEATDTPMGVAGYRDSIFYRELGEGFIAEAFQIAHAVDPDVLLFYNDFGIEGMFGAKPTFAFQMVSDLVTAGVPVDGIGLQMHTQSDDRGPGFVELQGNVARYAALGLAIDITEMDVSLCAIGNSEFALEAQRFRYNRVVSACLGSGACRAISLWGLGDANSWLNDTGCGMNAPDTLPLALAFDDGYKPKPAWWGIYDAFTGCSYR